MSIQNPSNNNQFTWINFYMELADKLLEFKDRRVDLFDKIKTLDKNWIKFMLQNEKTLELKFPELDPFSVFAIFNRKINARKEITQRFKELFQLKSELPSDFSGIPIAHHNHLIIFDYQRVNIADINALWDLFESAINYPNDSFSSLFDKALQIKGIALKNITIALYWIRPDKFITLDSHTQKFLIDNGIQISPNITGEQYLELIDTIPHFLNKSFPEISLEAWRSKHSLNDDIDDEDNEEDQDPDSFIKAAYNLLRFKKNIILQGAPGTGKTYSTAAIALGILGVDVDFNDHKAVMEKYEEYRKEKRRIFFTTFHQSMDYEDFVEGLKPELVKETEQNDNSNSTEKNVGVTYVCKRGIFKEACQAARVGQEFSKWLDDFLNSIIGFENKKEIPTVTGKSKIYVWWNIGNKTISVRPVSSTREPLDRFVAAPNIEKIKSQAANEEDPEDQEPNWPYYSQAIINYVSKEYGKNIQNDNKNNVVLIIDEINRGNVSKIFGELVTLLEKDKRDDNDHPITVTLPYSKEEFSVPSNVYIIGTMNTTDRSTGTLDYAIRRRFAFVTLPADREVIQLDIAKELFDDIEAFIKKYCPKDMDIDDLMVGHSYFMTEDEDELELKIKYEVVPLLKEYCNDGLLTCSLDELNERIEAWENLEIFDDSSVETEDETYYDEDEDQE